MRTLIIGYGNENRNDDGVGWFVVRELEKRHLPDVTLETVQQLEVDLAGVVRYFGRVIFVNAAPPDCPEPWRREEVLPGAGSSGVSHLMSPGAVLKLCRTLYGSAPPAMLFSIRGHDLGVGTMLSPEARLAAEAAIEKIAALIVEMDAVHA